MSTDRVLRRTSATLQVTFYVDGTATDPDGNAATVTVTREGSATPLADAVAATRLDTGVYSWVLPAQANLMALTLEWTGAFTAVDQTLVTYAEVVGARLFSLAAARAFRNQRLNDETKYPDSMLRDTREEVEDFFEHYCQVSFVPRYARLVMDGDGRDRFYLPHPRPTALQSATVDGVSVLADLLVYPTGEVRYPGGAFNVGDQNVVIEYEHGWSTTPGRVERAALVYLQQLLIDQGLLDRSIMHTDDTGTYRLSLPDVDRKRPTGVPFVDSILNEYTDYWGVV